MASPNRPEEVSDEARFDARRQLWVEGDASSSRERIWSHPSGATFNIRKPIPHRVQATFANGMFLSKTFFNRHGRPVREDEAIADWGQRTTADAIGGYVARGDFASDLKRFFPSSEPNEPEALPKKSRKLAKLPAAHRAAAEAFDALVRQGGVPEMGLRSTFRATGSTAKQRSCTAPMTRSTSASPATASATCTFST